MSGAPNSRKRRASSGSKGSKGSGHGKKKDAAAAMLSKPKDPTSPRINLGSSSKFELTPRLSSDGRNPWSAAESAWAMQGIRRRWDYVIVLQNHVRDIMRSPEPVPKPSQAEITAFKEWKEPDVPEGEPTPEKPEDPEEVYRRLTRQRQLLKQLRMCGLELQLIESEQGHTFVFITAHRDILYQAAEATELGLRLAYKTASTALENNQQVFPPREPENGFTVRVTCLKSADAEREHLDIEVDNMDTIAHIKRRVHQRRNAYAIHRQLMAMGETELWNPSKTVGELGITADTQLYVTLTPPRPEDRNFFRRQFHAEDLEELRYEYNWAGFSGAERLQLIDYKIISRIHKVDGQLPRRPDGELDLDLLKTGGAQVDLKREKSEKSILDSYPLHQPKEREELKDAWLGWKNAVKEQPMEKIRDYFGEKIAFYFLFLEFYTKALLAPAIIGLIVFIIQMSTDEGQDGPLVIPYAVFVVVWATIFIENWKRLNASKAYEWDVENYESEFEPERPEFIQFMTSQANEKKVQKISVGNFNILDMQKNGMFYYPPALRRLKIAASMATTVTGIVLVVSLVFSVVTFRAALRSYFATRTDSDEEARRNARYVAGLVTGVTIVVLNTAYVKVAHKLNDWENYRTDSEYENQLILKVFAFQFANSFASLFFIAFFEAPIAAVRGETDELDRSQAPLTRVFLQLFGILTVSQLVNNVKEIVMPQIFFWLAQRKNLAKAEELKDVKAAADADFKKRKPGPDAPREERRAYRIEESRRDLLRQGEEEFLMPPSGGTFEEYAEMMLQFGYSSMFVAAFPLAPLLAFVNNLGEIRLDASKFIMVNRRAEADSSSGMGQWLSVLQFISVFAVLTNVGIVFITADNQVLRLPEGLQLPFLTKTETPNCHTIKPWLPEGSTCTQCLNETGCYPALLWYMFVAEHVLIMLKLVLRAIIPDEPDWIREAKFATLLFEQKKAAGLNAALEDSTELDALGQTDEDGNEPDSDDEEAKA